ncbi:3-keto-5-aminohexanoate cleavage enzyme [Pseudovibrio axinellae]|uniref:3-keto-5-aminohexanoate cleavage enzyme n=1 Tax=Pseudovibrio axinellae TaxID=989403 RepID=A0A165UPC3_9HYPH|nr:3-keto-5-aminohexanoate cleavage protein [Pseudovibrio axinellae]KZL12649.1 3-keto-5-aminohexanoate cleavage enzyme [Pseudovibrio axinellae]SEP62993.1 Uncharacterized conserved protein, DUF849 family [Pseudovibrio axinellae]
MTKRLIMSAPNGARRGKADHPQLPVTIEEVVACAVNVEAEGADALHAHVRDGEGQHVLDAGLYKELLVEVTAICPELTVQITTEAVGRYTAQQQFDVVAAVEPEAVSVAMREMAPEGGDLDLARRFYHEAQEAGRALQHILYAPEDITRLDDLMAKGVVPKGYGSQLYVLGRYAKDQESDPTDLLGFLLARDAATHIEQANPFMLCAFGRAETACAALSFAHGGHARIGFENSLRHGTGKLAKNNAERIQIVAHIRGEMGYQGIISKEDALAVLGKPQ